MFAPAPLMDIRSEVLAAAAFGELPGLAATELPTVSGPVDSWLRAVVLGGQGRYAAARAQLRSIRGTTSDPTVLSLVASTEGSLLRQLGWHARASMADGRALAHLSAEPLVSGSNPVDTAPSTVSSGKRGVLGPTASPTAADFAVPDRAAALCDALTGLAADALGTGRTDLATRLLGRAANSLDAAHPRAMIRWHWVSAETALAQGRPEPASAHAAAGLAAAERCPSIRHRVKSLLLVAAAAMTRGDLAAAAEAADEVATRCREHELLPLGWACAMLRTGLSDASAAEEAARYGTAIARRGGHFRPPGVA
ncbi:hypothetical protein [Nocardia aurea]|uniref:hypothetical protein n=2 Tax=Nocardia TaxID=1817 RepID=UPI000D68C669|nr:hypothetical protein [Nocardia aurea]